MENISGRFAMITASNEHKSITNNSFLLPIEKPELV